LFALLLIDRDVLKSQISDLKSQIQALIPRCESVSRQLRGWADSLQNTDIKGQRHLNDVSRHDYELRQRSAQFMEYLQSIRDRGKTDPKSEI